MGAGERLADLWQAHQEARDARLRLERELDQVSCFAGVPASRRLHPHTPTHTHSPLT